MNRSMTGRASAKARSGPMSGSRWMMGSMKKAHSGMATPTVMIPASSSAAPREPVARRLSRTSAISDSP
ncbi:hypothetical protein GCM10018955_60460 [Planomonospora venezuelensis]